jgi:hypothetical protein
VRLSRRSNLLDCTFEACSQAACCYHQECLERYLKSIRCERCVASRGAPLQGSANEKCVLVSGPLSHKPQPLPRRG